MENLILTNEMISNVGCPLCGSISNTFLFNTLDHEYETTNLQFPLVECNDCKLKFLSPRPNLRALHVIYPPTYSNFSTSDSSGQSYVRRISNLIQSNRIKNLIKKYQTNLRSERLNILDVGCGDGHILDRVKEAYPNCNTYGVEPNEIAAQIASRRHNIFKGVFEDYHPKIQFDLIFSSHVIEHVESPILFLGKIRDGLAPNGVAVIDTPNIACLQYRIFGENWGGIHSPRHWTLFDTQTLALAAKSADLKVLETIEMPINTFWIWSVHAWLYSKGWKRFAGKFFNTKNCVSQKSFYYLIIMILAELFERLTGIFGFGLGQQRMVLEKK